MHFAREKLSDSVSSSMLHPPLIHDVCYEIMVAMHTKVVELSIDANAK